MPSVAQNISNF